MSKAVVFIADGLEECEGLLVVDILRRAGTEVTTASINGTKQVVSSHGITLFTDALAEEVDYDHADIVILPGGLRGTENLSVSSFVRSRCLEFAAGKKIAAICAAPSIFASLGLLKGKKATVHPGFEDRMNSCELTELARQLEGEEAAEKVAKAICWKR